MLYLINTGLDEQDSVLLVRLLRDFKKQNYDLFTLETSPDKIQLEEIVLKFSNFSFFSKPVVLVINRIKLTNELKDIILKYYKENNIVLVGTSADKRSLKKIEKSFLKELSSKAKYADIVQELEKLFPGVGKNYKLKENLIGLIKTSDNSSHTNFYSLSRLETIKKWVKLLREQQKTNEQIITYLNMNLDANADFWQQINLLFSKDKFKRFEYFSTLLQRIDQYEFINSLRSQLITLAQIKTLMKLNKSCSEIAKILKKNPFFVNKLCEINTSVSSVLQIIARLFKLEHQVRTGKIGDIKEGFFILLLTSQ